MKNTASGILKRIASFGMLILLVVILNTAFFSFMFFTVLKTTGTFSENANRCNESFIFHKDLGTGKFMEAGTFMIGTKEIVSNGRLFDIVSKKIKDGSCEISANRDEMEASFLHGLQTALGIEKSTKSNSPTQTKHVLEVFKFLISGNLVLKHWPEKELELRTKLSDSLPSICSTIECPPPELIDGSSFQTFNNLI